MKDKDALMATECWRRTPDVLELDDYVFAEPAEMFPAFDFTFVQSNGVI